MTTGETERALRALTCRECANGTPLYDAKHHHGRGAASVLPCTYNPELLPLFNAGIVGAYAAEAKEAAFRVRFLITGTPDEQAAHMESCILALTPADARLASQQLERMACGHIKADWVERPRTCGPSENCDCKTHGYCRTCAAIASAEARARLEGRAQLLDEMIREIKLDGLCMPINHQAMLDYLERLAAARTPDSTKEPE